MTSKSVHDIRLEAAGKIGDVINARRALRKGKDLSASAKGDAFWSAAANGHVDFIRELFDAFMPLDDSFIAQALAGGARYGRLEACKEILKRHVPTSDWGALGYAAGNDFPDIVALLLQHGASVNSNSMTTPLQYAVEGGNPAIVAEFLARGAVLEAKDHAAIKAAVEHTHDEVLAVLVGHAGPEAELPYAKYRKRFEASARELARLPVAERKKSLILGNGGASTQLKWLAASRMLPEFFNAQHWEGNATEAWELYQAVKKAVPDYLRPTLNDIDVTPFMPSATFMERIASPRSTTELGSRR